VNLDGSTLRQTRLDGVNVSAWTFRGSQFRGTIREFTCSGCQFDDAVLKNVVIENCVFSGGDFTGATFESAALNDVRFHQLDLTNVRFQDSAWKDVTLNDVSIGGMSSLGLRESTNVQIQDPRDQSDGAVG